MMDGKHVQALIYDWLNQHYPDANWQDPDFDCYGDAPIEIRMISAFDAIEYNIANGGWSQVLWNCFGRWRELLNIAAEGYTLIGASEQVDALRELHAFCARDEKECERMIYADSPSDDTKAFGAFTSFTKPHHAWERSFWAESGVYEKRLAWLSENEARVVRAVGASAA